MLNVEWFAHLPRYAVLESQTQPNCNLCHSIIRHFGVTGTFWHIYPGTLYWSPRLNISPPVTIWSDILGYRCILKQLRQILQHKGEHYKGKVLHASLQSTVPKYLDYVILPGVYELWTKSNISLICCAGSLYWHISFCFTLQATTLEIRN